MKAEFKESVFDAGVHMCHQANNGVFWVLAGLNQWSSGLELMKCMRFGV